MTLVASLAGKYLEAAKRRARTYRGAARSKMTLQRDRQNWTRFSDYVAPKNPWQATEEDVAAWCARMAKSGLKAITIEHYLSSLSYMYSVGGKGSLLGMPGMGIRKDNPALSALVRSTLRGIGIVQKSLPSTKAPITLAILEQLIELQPDTVRGAMKSSLYSIAWSGALRASELAALTVEKDGETSGYVRIQQNGISIHLIRTLGGSVKGRWETVCVPLRNNKPQFCPTRLLRKWLEKYDAKTGPLFPRFVNDSLIPDQRLYGGLIAFWIKRDIAELGLPAENFAVSSFRIGCLEWLQKEGVSELEYMKHACLRSNRGLNIDSQVSSAIKGSALVETQWCG